MIQLLAAMFLSLSDPLLHATSDPICPCHIEDVETQEQIDTLYETAKKVPYLVGLAAPQVGIPKRIILVDLAATGIFTENSEPPPPELKEFINPEIVWRSDESLLWREGCLSIPHICGIVPRSDKLLLRWYDRKGDVFTQEFSGYTARILQHEVDHLDGILFPDRIENDSDLHWVETEQFPNYRIHWAEWEQKCPRSKWNAMKEVHP